MKVKELIAELEKYDGDTEVITMEYDGHDQKGIEIEHDSFTFGTGILMWNGEVKNALIIQ